MDEKTKLAHKLSEASKANKKLRKENQNLLNLQDGVKNDMKNLSDHHKRRVPIDIFKSLPKQVQFKRSNCEDGSYGIHTQAELNREEELKREKKEADLDYKRKRKEAREESEKRRRLASPLSSEYRNVDKNRKSMQFTDAIPILKRSRGNKSCVGGACQRIKDEHGILKDENSCLRELDDRVTIASALVFRQLLCAQAFCNYAMHFLYKAEFNDQGKVRKFLHEILPRYISSFISSTGSTHSVRIMLAERETRAWHYTVE